jgi:NAD(P)-dependent dehydrogenase (short-subunit alcohol dehydrogenase family)
MSALPRTPDPRLAGRRAVVTGAGSGIGLGAAAALAEAGVEVTLLARSPDRVGEGVRLIREAGGVAHASVLDVTDTPSVAAFFQERAAFDILINNAGTNRPKSMLDVVETDYDTVLDLNLKSAFFVAQAAIRRMVQDEVAGSLIHMSSQMGHVGGVHRSLYCASKWGLEGLSKAIAIEFGSKGIRSNTIAPTFIRTPMTSLYLEDEKVRRYIVDKIKLGRLGEVEDIMSAVLFLASDASALMTGSTLMLDGGWTAE